MSKIKQINLSAAPDCISDVPTNFFAEWGLPHRAKLMFHPQKTASKNFKGEKAPLSHNAASN